MRLPVLTYHAVLDVERGAGVRGTVPLCVFREQVAWLRRRGFTALTLDQAADVLEGKAAAPRRPVVLTFDDGYRCVIECALPLLEEAGFTATLFVVTGVVGRTTDWYARKGGPSFEHATWEELQRARESGFEIASHGVRHTSLGETGPQALREEVYGSKDEISRRLGRCEHFAYPYGVFTPEAVGAVREAGYRTACTTRPGLNRRGQPLETLHRQGVSRTTSAVRLRRKVGRWW